MSEWIYLEPSLRHEFFGEVKHRLVSAQQRSVEVVIKPDNSLGFELAITSLAIDASRSMLRTFAAHLPPMLRKKQNKVPPIARELAKFLAKNSRNQCALAYWSCGGDGSEFEPIGLMSAADIESYDFAGVSVDRWGGGTKLTPLVQYMWQDIFADADKVGVAVILTDGAWDEDDQVHLKQLTDVMANEIASGRRHLMKGVVLGLKTDDNKSEIEHIKQRFNDLNNHEAAVDIWYTAWVDELNDFTEIFIELVKEWPLGIGGSIEAGGKHVLQAEAFNFGIQFQIPASATSFVLHLSGMAEYEQRLL